MMGQSTLAGRLAWLIILLTGSLPRPAAGQESKESALELGDLRAYREALQEQQDAAGPVVPIRGLYDRPSESQGRWVTVQGRLVRRFRQDAVGEFPPLVESWLGSTGGNLVCVVHPSTSREHPEPIPIGTVVRFSGRYLKRLRYEGEDQARFAPLIVGGGTPTVVPRRTEGSGSRQGQGPGFSQSDWMIAAVAGGLVMVLLAARMLRAPLPSRERGQAGPPLEFFPSDDDNKPRPDGAGPSTTE